MPRTPSLSDSRMRHTKQLQSADLLDKNYCMPTVAIRHLWRFLPVPLVLLVSLAICAPACGSKTKQWWCHDVGVCYATKKECEWMGAGTEASCTEKPIAFCAMGCTPTTNGPYCREQCAVDELSCDDTLDIDISVPCLPTRPVKRAELFPDYSMPGWWCSDVKLASGPGSLCDKSKEKCEWTLGLFESAVPSEVGTCEFHDDVTCYSYHVDSAPAGVDDRATYACAISVSDCQALLELAKASAIAQPTPMSITSECELWKYKSSTEGRIVRTSQKRPEPGLTLRFVLDTDNSDPVRSIKLLRSRSNALGFDSVQITLTDNRISIHLPDADIESKDRVIELLTIDAPWTAHHVVSTHKVMDSLRLRVLEQGAASGVRIKVDKSGTPYLFAEDSEKTLTKAEATLYRCPDTGEQQSNNSVLCLVSGAALLETFIKRYLETFPPGELSTLPIFGFEQMNSGWRSHLLNKEPVLSNSDIEWANTAWDQRGNRPMVNVRWTDRFHAPGQSRLGNVDPLAIKRENSRIQIVVPIRKDGNVAFAFGGADELRSMALATDLVNVIKTGVPTGVQFQDFEEVRPGK